MNSRKYILALDEGTTSCRAVLFDAETFDSVAFEQKKLTMIYPTGGWVEQNAEEIFDRQIECAEKLINGLSEGDEIVAIGITNQRESVLIWDKDTGKPLGPCINWQCRRTAPTCEELKKKGLEKTIKEKTGLVIDAYFSATKLKWLLDNTPGARGLARRGRILAGTIDSYLIYRLTEGKKHITDITNASRTMLCDITTKQWDEELLKLFDIPKMLLPSIVECAGDFGECNIAGRSIKICGCAGDQQASLFGQACLDKGDMKCTYGTGAFVLANIGKSPVISDTPLITTVAYSVGGRARYALEGSVFNAGAVVDWLVDIGLLSSAKESEEVMAKARADADVFFIPAFSGLGAPYWDMNCRAAFLGLTRGSGKSEIVKAAVESIAFRVSEICELVEKTIGQKIQVLHADGGAAANSLLLQFQADLTGAIIYRSVEKESTALGAAYLAAIGAGIFTSEWEIAERHKNAGEFIPSKADNIISECKKKWAKAVEAARCGALNE